MVTERCYNGIQTTESDGDREVCYLDTHTTENDGNREVF